MWMSTQSQMNHTRTWTRKTAMGSHRKRKDVDHAAITPNNMHSDIGSKRIVIGVDAMCSFLHLKENKKHQKAEIFLGTAVGDALDCSGTKEYPRDTNREKSPE